MDSELPPPKRFLADDSELPPPKKVSRQQGSRDSFADSMIDPLLGAVLWGHMVWPMRVECNKVLILPCVCTCYPIVLDKYSGS